jgi:hypothetical protein
LNLTHRESHASPSPLEPDKTYRVSVQLNHVAQTFPKGHRLRIAISSSYFPLAWPPPKSTQLQVHTANSHLKLPVHEPSEEQICFPEAEMSASSQQQQLTEGHHNWRVIRDLDKDISTLEVINDNGTNYLEDINLKVQRKTEEWYSYQADDFNSVRGETLWTRSFERDDWRVKTITRTLLHCDENHFYLDAELDAYEGDKRIFSKNWNRRIKRNMI